MIKNEIIELIKNNITNIGYGYDLEEKQNNGAQWEFKIDGKRNKKITIYHTGKFQTQGAGFSIEEARFFSELIKEIIDTGRGKYTSDNLEYVEIIENLRKETAEQNYFDFKVKYSGKVAKIVEELISLINNTSGRKSYLIFGIDDDANIVGVSKDEKIDEDQFNNAIASLKFGKGHIREAIQFKEVCIRGKVLQIIECLEYEDVPLYLEEDVKTYSIKAGRVCTRVGGTKATAKYDDIEKLWKLHFERKNK